MNEQQELSEVDSTEEDQADQFDCASQGEVELLQTSTNNVASLDEGSIFFVDRSSRFGRSIKINSRFLSWLCCHLWPEQLQGGQFNWYVFCVHSVDICSFFHIVLQTLLVSNCWIFLRICNPHLFFLVH